MATVGSARALRLPITFEPNVGQAAPEVRFLARTAAGTILLTQTGLAIVTAGTRGEQANGNAGEGHAGSKTLEAARRDASPRDPPRSLTLKLVGVKGYVELVPEEPLPGVVNYFLGNDPARWRRKVPTYAAVRYRHVYPGIDLVFRANQELRYDFEVAPGADPSVIRLAISGADVHMNEAGNLVVGDSACQVVHRRPMAFQTANHTTAAVVAAFSALEANTFGFRLGTFDGTRALTIDPTVEVATFLGGSGNDQAASVATDQTGNVYVIGTTNSVDFPTVVPFEGSGGGTHTDVFVAKFDPSLSHLLCSTYLGGRADDGASNAFSSIGSSEPSGPHIAVAADGSAVVTGWTASTDFPTTPGALQTTNAGGLASAFVTRLDPSGSHLAYSTYLGGTGGSSGNAVAVSADGSAYVVGYAGAGFPEVSPVAEAKGAVASAFVAKLSPDGRSLGFSTRFGGSGTDVALSVAGNGSSQVWVVGSAASGDFPVKNALQPHFGGGGDQGGSCGLGDAFVAKFDTSTPTLVYSTYLGGSDWDFAASVAIDAQGSAYVGGLTASANLPIVGGFQQHLMLAGGCAGFLAKLAPDGSSLVYSSYLGGTGSCASQFGGCPIAYQGITAVAVDGQGQAWATGRTSALDFPVARAVQGSLAGLSDAFVAEVSANGSALLFSTYLGGSEADGGEGIALDGGGNVIVGGQTRSSDFPTRAGYSSRYAGNGDAFVFKLSVGTQALTAAVLADPTSGLAPLAVSFTGSASGGTGLYGYSWDFGDGSPHSNQQRPTHTYTLGGDYTATLKVVDSASASAAATVVIHVTHNCSLACTASAPLAVAAGHAAAFSASSTPSDCVGSATYFWAFGDGQTSTEQSPTHAYASAGVFAWSVKASIGAATCTRTGSIAVASAPINASYLVPALAHKGGYLGTRWRSDVAVAYPLASPAPANLTLVFRNADGEPLLATAAVPAGGTLEWRDVITSLFGQPDTVAVSGSLEIYSDHPVAVTARTYNQTDVGTLGQSYPALTPTDGIPAGSMGILPGLKKNAAFRTNVGAINLGAGECAVRITLFGGLGVQIGSPLTLVLGGGRWQQIDDVFRKSGSGERDLAYAVVEVETPGGRAWAYASVIDNATGDPTTVPVTVP